MATFNANYLLKLTDGSKKDYMDILEFLNYPHNIKWATASRFQWMLVRKDGTIDFTDSMPAGLLNILNKMSLRYFKTHYIKPQISIGGYYGANT